MEEEKALEVIEVSPVLPVVSMEEALESWRTYQRLCREILDDSDYAEIRGRLARKRSGWAKLRRFYGVSTEILEEEFWETEDDWGFDFVVKACLPWGRCEVGDGSCSASELRGSNIEPTRHNVRSKALTRAKNRATSDLIGGGEVSAEELPLAEEPAPRVVEAEEEVEAEELVNEFWEAVRWFKEQVSQAKISGALVNKALGGPFDEWLRDRLHEDPSADALELAKEALADIIAMTS